MKQSLEKVRDDPLLRGRTFVFKDRVQAGTLLAKQLKQYLVQPALILAIPRGGIPVAFAISEEMSAPFDLIISRKIPLPYTLEAGYGAVTWNDIVILNTELTTQLQLTEKEIQEGILSAKQQVEKHSIQYRGYTSLPNPKDKTVILVDDGIASGYSMLAAIKFVQQHTPRKIVVAIPTAPARSLYTISPFIDKIECLNIRDTQYFAVADAYLNWQDLTEKTAFSYLKDARYFLKASYVTERIIYMSLTSYVSGQGSTMTISLAPFVPSQQDVVKKMLELAQVNKKDTVFDLGCGDGRILISAVKDFRAKRAVGYEMRDDLYKNITLRIQKEQLEDRVKVFNEDLLNADISDATVITLYLTTSGNSRLKPKLSMEAQKGVKVVSHDFDIVGWEYTKKENFGGHTIYLYVIPNAFSSTRKRRRLSLFSRKRNRS